jgi:hypothetical protein
MRVPSVLGPACRFPKIPPHARPIASSSIETTPQRLLMETAADPTEHGGRATLNVSKTRRP